ncbi:MAG TPA: hypothetical protein VIG99_15570, partial [Myxococcaceae bacterium]
TVDSIDKLLGRKLMRGAEIWLLGCETGSGSEGLGLVQEISNRSELKDNDVTVRAASKPVNTDHFGPCGFMGDDLITFSSARGGVRC